MATVEERLMKVEEGFIKVVDLLEKHSELLAEIKRDSQKTQRLWVRLAQRHGWIVVRQRELPLSLVLLNQFGKQRPSEPTILKCV